MDSNKIFIDTDSEITFVLERILSSRNEKVVLVVPDRAALLSSITGLKLIKRVVDKSQKLMVLVTLDEIGAELAKSAGLLVVSRVGEISDNLWEKAQSQKFDVIKRSKNPYYVPDVLENEITQSTEIAHHTNLKEQDTNINLNELVGSKNEEDIQLAEVDPNKDVEEVPQVRINVDVKEIELEREDIKEEIDEIKESAPSFLSKEEDSSSTKIFDHSIKELDFTEIKEDKIEKPQPHNFNTEITDKFETPEENNIQTSRVRKTTQRKTGISNLSFSFGKDISEKKN